MLWPNSYRCSVLACFVGCRTRCEHAGSTFRTVPASTSTGSRKTRRRDDMPSSNSLQQDASTDDAPSAAGTKRRKEASVAPPASVNAATPQRRVPLKTPADSAFEVDSPLAHGFVAEPLAAHLPVHERAARPVYRPEELAFTHMSGKGSIVPALLAILLRVEAFRVALLHDATATSSAGSRSAAEPSALLEALLPLLHAFTNATAAASQILDTSNLAKVLLPFVPVPFVVRSLGSLYCAAFLRR
jgi:hypothetical protein